MLPEELLPSVAVALVAAVVALEVIPVDAVEELPWVVVVFAVVVVEVEVIPVVVAFVVVVEVEVVVIPVGATVGGAGQSPGSATGPNSLPDSSGPNGDCSNPHHRPYHK